MKKKIKSKKAKNIRSGITFFTGVTFAYLMWISWQKLTELIGNSYIVWGLTAGIVVLAMLTGYFSFNKIYKKFVD